MPDHPELTEARSALADAETAHEAARHRSMAAANAVGEALARYGAAKTDLRNAEAEAQAAMQACTEPANALHAARARVEALTS
jgi:hypothetical protein